MKLPYRSWIQRSLACLAGLSDYEEKSNVQAVLSVITLIPATSCLCRYLWGRRLTEEDYTKRDARIALIPPKHYPAYRTRRTEVVR